MEVHTRIASGDHAVMTDLTVAAARRQLDHHVADGWLQSGDEIGRNAHFAAGASMRETGSHDAW